MEILRDNIEERIRKVKEPEEPQGLDKIKKQINDVITLWVMGGIDPNKATPNEEGYYDNKVQIIEVFMALQKQSYILGNSLTNLVEHWPHEEIFLVHSSEGIQTKIRTQK